MSAGMSDQDLVGAALERLDLAFVEWQADGVCRPIAPTPPWFKGTTAWGALPFLEGFVNEARRYLHDHLGDVFMSDQFTVEGREGELLLRTHALTIDRRLVLVIERLRDAADVRPILREAREQALAHEALTERARAVHRPVDELARTVERLRQHGGDAATSRLVEDLARAVAALKEAAASLPPPRKKR